MMTLKEYIQYCAWMALVVSFGFVVWVGEKLDEKLPRRYPNPDNTKS